jgi:hypothetical protein
MLVAGQEDIPALDITVGDALDLVQVAKAAQCGLHDSDRLYWGESDTAKKGVCQAAQGVVRRHNLDDPHRSRITFDRWRDQYGHHIVVIDRLESGGFRQDIV